MEEDLTLTSLCLPGCVTSALLPVSDTQLSSVFYHSLLSVAHWCILIVTWKLLIQSGDQSVYEENANIVPFHCADALISERGHFKGMVHFWTVGNLQIDPRWDSRTLECAWTDALSHSLPIFISEITHKHWEAASCSESDDSPKHFFKGFLWSLICFSVFSRTHRWLNVLINTGHPETICY